MDELPHYKELYQFLSLNDIEILFISVDKQRDKEHWKKIIKKYNLKGYHILANKALKQDIKRVTNMKGIPWYMIKQKDGTLSKEFIYRPGFKTKLYKQLKKYMDQ
jgi:alkyl hydroperoxide reductase subunit AhpC